MLALLVAGPAMAEDWVVSRVRGEAVQLVQGQWIDLVRGDAIPDARAIRTGPDGRVGLTRAAETIELGASTEIKIADAGGDDRMTSVIQTAGLVSIEAERRNVQHFSVQTPFLAAVVKGTRFTVEVAGKGATVSVQRGVVQVQDTGRDLVTDITVGQQATVTDTMPLDVAGRGAPVVFTFNGVQVVPGEGVALKSRSDNGNAAGRGNGAEHANGRDDAGGKGHGADHSNAGGSDHGNASGKGHGADHSNAGGHGNAGGKGHGSEHSNAGGNGKGGDGDGKGKGRDRDDDNDD